MNQQMKAALTAAEDLLSRRNKLTQAIAVEVAKLPALIEAREAAERTFAKSELATAIDEATGGTMAKARVAVTASRAAIDQVADKLRCLRSAVLEFGTELAERHSQLSATIPAFNEALEQAFAVEWEKAIAGYEHLLGQRQAIEALTGHKMTLPEPTPTPADLGPAARPHQVLNDIAAGIKHIAAAARTAAAGPSVDPYTHAPMPYDPTAIYVMKKPFGGVQEGAHVVDATFEPGRLQQLVGSRWATPAATAEKRRAADEARLASQKIEAAEAAELERRRKAEQAELQRARDAEDAKHRPHSTTRAALEDAHAKHLAEVAAAGVAPNR